MFAGNNWDGIDPECENLGGTAYVATSPAHIGGNGGNDRPVQTTAAGWSSAKVCWDNGALTGLQMLPGGTDQVGSSGCTGTGSPGTVSCPTAGQFIVGVCMIDGPPPGQGLQLTRQFGIICG